MTAVEAMSFRKEKLREHPSQKNPAPHQHPNERKKNRLLAKKLIPN